VLAVDEADTIVGFVNGGPEREGDPVYQAELYAIYVLQEAQRHGLGRRLVKELTRFLAERYFASMMLWVLASNPACRFYEALGGQVIKQRQNQIGGAFYDELAYGWQDLSLNKRQVYVCRGAVPHPRATARVPAPPHSTPALTKTTGRMKSCYVSL
jgi:GNAT superfamily N-acetyltransferase